MITTLRQFFFGLRVFFRGLTVRNLAHISRFLFKRFVLGRPVPFSVVLALTYRCQCRCVHCSIGDYQAGNELSGERLASLIDDIATEGAVKITFFGGEPLVHPDVEALVRRATARGVRSSLDTNGLLLTRDLALRLKAAGIGNINVSLDSAVPATHDTLRKFEGCFKAAVQAIRVCRELGIPCLVSTYASKRSLADGDLANIIKLARELGASGVKILFPILSGQWRKKEEERLDECEEAALMALMDPGYVYLEDALQMTKKRGKGCSAGERNLVYISPQGDVQPCPAVPVSFGSLSKKSFGEVMAFMYGHEFFRHYGGVSGCLMNEVLFRARLFSSGAVKYPIDISELPEEAPIEKNPSHQGS